MVAVLSTIFLSLVMGQAASAAEISRRDDSCTSVHIFLARGTGEPYPGRQSTLTSAICSKLPSCDYEDIVYPASNVPSYCVSVQGGKMNGTAQILAYAERCPSSKLVLSGYSQGGQVVGDILGGGGGYLFNECEQPSSPELSRTTSAGDKSAFPF
jgi:acetylxylan esterase